MGFRGHLTLDFPFSINLENKNTRKQENKTYTNSSFNQKNNQISDVSICFNSSKANFSYGSEEYIQKVKKKKKRKL